MLSTRKRKEQQQQQHLPQNQQPEQPPPVAAEDHPKQPPLRNGSGLVVDDVREIFRCLQTGDQLAALIVVKDAMGFHPPAIPPFPEADKSSAAALRRGLQSSRARADMLANAHFQLLLFAHQTGFLETQALALCSLQKAVHENFVAALARGREAARKECVDSFRKTLSRLVNGDGGVAQPLPRPDRYTPWQSPGQQPRKVFSAQEALLVVDYFCKSYIQHIRLIECAFTQHQAVDTKARRLSLEKVAVPPPLSTGMPEEHWLEHLKQEEERRQMEAAEQQARLQALQEEALLASYRNKEVKFQDENDGAHVSTSTAVPYQPYQQPMPPPPVLPEDRPMRSTSDVTSLAVSVASSHLDALTAHFQGYLQHDHRQHVERLQRVQEMAKKDPTSGASPAPSAPAPGAEKAASPAPAGKTRVKSAKDSPGK